MDAKYFLAFGVAVFAVVLFVSIGVSPLWDLGSKNHELSVQEVQERQKEVDVQQRQAAAQTAKNANPIDEFFREYEEMLEAINAEPLPGRQEELCRALTKKLDDVLEPQTWELHCRIQNVDSQPDHHFNISHQAPDEVDLIPDGWTILAKVSSVEAKPPSKGDYLVYTGTPRFDTVAADSKATARGSEYSNLKAKKIQPLSAGQPVLPDSRMFYCTIEIGNVQYTQALHLTDFRVKFEKLAEAKADLAASQNVIKSVYNLPQPIQDVNPLNYYPHPYYFFTEWAAFCNDHHYHHAHENEPDQNRNPPSSLAAAATSITPASDSPVTGKPSPPEDQSKNKEEYDTNRKAAEAVIALGGKASIRGNGKTVVFANQESLPTEPFLIEGIDFMNDQRLAGSDLSQLRGLKNLKSLNLGGTKITDADLYQLADLEGLLQLRLGGDAITDEGLKAIGSLKNLEHLGLFGTKVTDQGIQYLRPLAHLESINVGQTKVSTKAIKSVFPNCKIYRPQK